ncbi:hypothetical protein GGR56DRAFT_648289 [Xylariaceae sp. FL0804]|nr:hypothetical protein GGR56DRAFT_648289 [Xylariaceae sp. FL0804]
MGPPLAVSITHCSWYRQFNRSNPFPSRRPWVLAWPGSPSFPTPPHLSAAHVDFFFVAIKTTTRPLRPLLPLVRPDRGDMLWTPWAAYIPTFLFVAALLAWWFSEPKTTHLNIIVVLGGALFYWAVALDLAQETPQRLYQLSKTIATQLQLDVLLLYHANMLVTGIAFVWLAHRAVQTLRKSVSELVGVLAVDVPDAPDVSLAGIRANAATLNWTRPLPNRPVAKFTIQVNGVNVGDSANQETAITVTGLKPNHFYNVRVIAVGANNFQAGSRVIRLRTFGRDGRPQLGDERVPSNFVPEDQQLAMPAEQTDEDGVPLSPAAGVEAAPIPDTSNVPSRETPNSSAIPRRNTLTRKHSPSATSIEQSLKDALTHGAEQSLQELGEKFNAIRKETEEIQAQIAKDEKEHKEIMDKLTEEKKTKLAICKEKEDTTEKLRRETGSTERAMRSVQQRKTQKEKLLREKQNERQKLYDDISNWEKDVASMRKRQACFDSEKVECQDDGDARAEELRQEIAQAQANYAKAEVELKEKSKELKDAEEQRKKLPGGEESDESRENHIEVKKSWDIRYRDLQRRSHSANKRLRMVNDYGNVLRTQLAAAQQSGLPFLYSQANSSGVDFEMSNPHHLKRRSRNSNTMPNMAASSPGPSYPAADRHLPTSSTFGPSRPPTLPPGFAQGPYMDHATDFANPLDEQGIRALTGGAPLSPTATSLLPAGMLDDVLDEPPSPASRPARHDTFGSGMSYENHELSPASSARSPSLMSSPRGSAQHLPYSQYAGEMSEHRSLRGPRAEFGSASSPLAQSSQATSRKPFLPWLHRGAKAGTDDPPALGSLKSGQSQSLPRQADDGEPMPNKRRISFSASWNMFHRNSPGAAAPEGSPSPRGLPSRRLGLGAHANSVGSNIMSDRDPSSPRPVSIASSDLIPRPSTDSGSIWNRAPHPSRLWSAEENPWTSSRNPSRRPSLHGSPSLLKTNLADADDEILDEADLMHAASNQVGVIGTKPTAKSLSQRLNPAAPTFMAGLFRPKADKDKETSDRDGDPKEKSRSKGKERDAKDRKPRESLTSASEAGSPSMDESPTDRRKSRDAFSVNTPSVTESRESLSLDQPFSNSPSEQAGGLGLKDAESGLRKLLRKGSSSKFSFSSVRGLGNKKGPNSVASSEKNTPVERTSFDDFGGDEYSSQLMGRSYESSPSLGPMSAKAVKDKPASWGARFAMKKKAGKEKESLDLERDDSAPPTPVVEER